ncbi:hypothetical protein [Nocardia sp. NPDC052566]|uniref:hypothetical protein n=1 Tax=Nocardia sp. NPDC052566 TaxID=3364330 RepID=UPI0037CC8919
MRAAAPTPSVNRSPAPKSTVFQAFTPATATSVVDDEVPLIRPYLVATFGGSATMSAEPGGARIEPAMVANGRGRLSITESARGAVVSGADAEGIAATQVAIRSGRALVPAALGGSGAVTCAISGVRPLAAAGSDGALAASSAVVSAIDVGFGSDGHYSAVPPQTANHTGDGGLTTSNAVIGSIAVAAPFSGVSALAGLVTTRASLSGQGSLSVAASQPATLTGAGTLESALSARVRSEAGHSAAGALSVATALSFRPARMTKSGDWAKMTNAWKTIPGWVADTGSTVSNDGLVVQGPKAGASVSASIVFTGTGGWSGHTVTLRLLVGSTVVVTGADTDVATSGDTTVQISKTNLAVAAGDVVTVQVKGDESASEDNAKINSNAASYVRVI